MHQGLARNDRAEQFVCQGYVGQRANSVEVRHRSDEEAAGRQARTETGRMVSLMAGRLRDGDTSELVERVSGRDERAAEPRTRVKSAKQA